MKLGTETLNMATLTSPKTFKMAACVSPIEPWSGMAVETRYLARACDKKLLQCCDVRVQLKLKVILKTHCKYFFGVLSWSPVNFFAFERLVFH